MSSMSSKVCMFSSKNEEMDFFDQSDESQTDSDISDHEDETCFDGESAREEDILLRDGLLQHLLPRKKSGHANHTRSVVMTTLAT